MATRNLTSKFDSIRSQLHSGTKRPRDFDGGKNSLLGDSSSSDAVESGRGLGLGADQEMPPEWVDITDAIHADTNKVKESSQPQRTTATRLHSGGQRHSHLLSVTLRHHSLAAARQTDRQTAHAMGLAVALRLISSAFCLSSILPVCAVSSHAAEAPRRATEGVVRR